MGIFSGCILASDFDGTLANSQGFIPQEVKIAIKYFIAQGGLFTVCTGRTKQGFHAFEKELFNAPVLLANGSMAYDYAAEKTVFLTGIEKESAPGIENIINGFQNIGIELYGADFKSYVINPHKRNISHFEYQSISYSVVNALPENLFPAVKIMVSVGKERCEEFMRFLDHIDLHGLKYIPQHGDFIEIISSKTDKGKALMKIAKEYNISFDRVFSIGDGENDVEMLKAAAVGFVPENGCAEAKNAGKVIVKSNDDFAVADAINHIKNIVNS